MAYAGNGPRAGRTTGRQRNSLLNNASKTPPPVVGPSSAINYGQQTAAAQMTLSERLATLKAQQGLIAGQFRMDRAQVKADAIGSMAGAVNSALDRGILNSSIDYGQRAGVLSERASGIQAAVQAKLAGKLGLRTERIGAFNDYYNQLFAIQSAKSAEQQEMATQAFLNDLVMRLGDEQGPPGRGPGGRTAQTYKGSNLDEILGTAAREGGGTAAKTGPNQAQKQLTQLIAPFINFLPESVRRELIGRLQNALSMGLLGNLAGTSGGVGPGRGLR